MQITIDQNELYSMIKKAVREVIEEKEISHFLHSCPTVSDEEMNEINESYGSPDQYNDIAFSEKIEI